MKTLFAFFKRKSEEQIKIKNIVGFYPDDVFFYQIAFIHKSTANQSDLYEHSNERLELLGDAILSAIISDYLFKEFPNMQEGELSAARAKIVSRETLNEIALKMGLENHIISNLPVHQVSANNSLPGNALEALIGATYLDKGYHFCKDYVLKNLYHQFADLNKLIEKEVNYKSKVLEWGQKFKKEIEFECISESGIGMDKIFKVHLKVNQEVKAEGQGSSKKRAEQQVAEKFLISIQDGET